MKISLKMMITFLQINLDASEFNEDIDASYSPIRTAENNYYTNTEWSWSDVFSRYELK